MRRQHSQYMAKAHFDTSVCSLLLVHAPQLVNLFQDLDLEILDYLPGCLWALLQSSHSASVIVDWKNLIDLRDNIFLGIAFEHCHSYLVKYRILQAFLCRGSEERIVF